MSTFKHGDHSVICDVCGTKRYRSECRYTWDGFLACTVNNCWYPKDPLFMVPPVINDPQPLYDVRPDKTVANTTFIDPGSVSTWNHIVSPPAEGGRVVWGSCGRLKWGGIDNPQDFMGD